MKDRSNPLVGVKKTKVVITDNREGERHFKESSQKFTHANSAVSDRANLNSAFFDENKQKKNDSSLVSTLENKEDTPTNKQLRKRKKRKSKYRKRDIFSLEQ